MLLAVTRSCGREEGVDEWSCQDETDTQDRPQMSEGRNAYGELTQTHRDDAKEGNKNWGWCIDRHSPCLRRRPFGFRGTEATRGGFGERSKGCAAPGPA